jgi:hypothetical protein
MYTSVWRGLLNDLDCEGKDSPSGFNTHKINVLKYIKSKHQ